MFEKIERNNFWKGEVVGFGYVRRIYLKKLENYLGNSLVKVLLGQRRVGKSYILRMLINHLITEKAVSPANILYINMDLQDFSFIKDSQSLLDAVSLYKSRLQPSGRVYIFLDEVQEIKDWEKAVNSLSQQFMESYEVFITGSNAKILSSELATYLSGRYVSFNIYPFSFAEYCGIKSFGYDKASFLEYLKIGGMPELYALTNLELQQNYISSLKDSIVLRDVIRKNNIRDSILLDKLVDFLIDSVGSSFSVNSVVKTLTAAGFRTNNETIGNYIEFLKDAFFIHSSRRFDLKGRRILKGEQKIYLNDLAFKYYLSSSFDFGIGRYLENIIFMELCRQQYVVYTGGLNGKEIDFIAEKKGERKYVQVAYLLSSKDVIDREFGNLELINDNYEKLVVSMDDVNFGNRDGIRHINAWDFCSELN